MKTISNLCVAVMLTAVAAPNLAAPLYKCEIAGALAFQDTPCPPVKAKQKIACADVDGFAVYQDSLDAACANAPAGTAKSYDFSNNGKQKTATVARSGQGSARKSTAGKEVIVRGYTKEDGTKVPSHTRSLPGEKPKE
jgi:hypothetical protein